MLHLEEEKKTKTDYFVFSFSADLLCFSVDAVKMVNAQKIQAQFQINFTVSSGLGSTWCQREWISVIRSYQAQF